MRAAWVFRTWRCCGHAERRTVGSRLHSPTDRPDVLIGARFHFPIRQVNVDYAICEALKTTRAHATNGVILAYDINCQYSINFRKRFLESRYLFYPESLPIDFVVGLFHVHGHKDECLARFAPTFLPGSGITSGEILESLWSTTNGAARITRNMTLVGRREALNACLQDSNRRKMQGLREYLLSHFLRFRKH